MRPLIRFFQTILKSAPSQIDLLALSVFTVLITFNPFYLNHQIDIFEFGLYLPGINAIMHGAVPYRDFFHLRGPLDLYMPGLLMMITKPNIAILSTYFYFGNVLCLLFAVLIAYELLKTRYMFYLMVPALVSRTFPRVVFTYWGGMRYAFGLIAIWCFIKFFKKSRSKWMYASGLATAFGLLTSIEMGIYAMVGIITALVTAWLLKFFPLRSLIKTLGTYFLGIGTLLLPWVIYAISNQAFIPYLKDTLTVVLNMQKVIDPHAASIYPHNLPEALSAMFNPMSINFKQMTPSYLYVSIAVYLGLRLYKKMINATDLCLLVLSIYGFIMYNTGFRGIWTAHFEMALMPEKIIYFFLGEALILFIWSKQERNIILCVILLALFISSTTYAIDRFNHRFFAFKYYKHALQDKNNRALSIDRARGILVPSDQADELEAMVDFLKHHSQPTDTVVMFPELGAYNFLADRPFLGKFPISTFSWFDDEWFSKFLDQLQNAPVRYIFVQKATTESWRLVYLYWKPNQSKYAQMLSVIQHDYMMIGQTPLCYIYTRRTPPLSNR